MICRDGFNLLLKLFLCQRGDGIIRKLRWEYPGGHYSPSSHDFLLRKSHSHGMDVAFWICSPEGLPTPGFRDVLVCGTSGGSQSIRKVKGEQNMPGGTRAYGGGAGRGSGARQGWQRRDGAHEQLVRGPQGEHLRGGRP